MIALIYSKDDIDRMIKYAEEHPIPFAVLSSEQRDFTPYHFWLPGRMACFTFTIEEQSPGRWFKHFSVLPAFQKEVVAHLCNEFGIDLDSAQTYDYLDDAGAVNVDHPCF